MPEIQAQDILPDDPEVLPTTAMEEVTVRGYLQPLDQFVTPASTAVLHTREIRLRQPESLTSAVNTVPGVRMEERSPGSYRLSIRGSLLRSPYGVRNVKVYYNGFALTDGGGNTYLNALNATDIAQVEILKGPDGSLFGANSGGVVLLGSDGPVPDETSLRVFGGAYGLVGEAAHVGRRSGRHTWSVRQSYQRADGYRRNTRNHRLFAQLADSWNYAKQNKLEALFFYSDFAYRTPGGLTAEQYEADPRQSRPATSKLPGSAEQKTGTDARMVFGGLRHILKPTDWLKHTISVWGNYVDYTNRAISNYETRDEHNLGLRTYFSFLPCGPNTELDASIQLGFEGQRMGSTIRNYDNLQGDRGELQVGNKIVSYQYFPFLRGDLAWRRWVVHAALSVNFNGYDFRDETGVRNDFDPVWMPHVGVNYRVADPVTLRLTFSRGYSTPTTAEIRPTDNKIYADLQPEKGWNTEFGVRLRPGRRFTLDASVFHYLLRDGIVSRSSESGDTYFVNSGRIRQVGIEAAGEWLIKPWNRSDFLRMVRWKGSFTWSRFRYELYVKDGDDFTGNKVPGIPQQVAVNSLEFQFPHDLYLFAQYTLTGRIPLDDANSVFAGTSNLLWLRIGWDRTRRASWPIEIFAAVDNLLDEKYSLGNDINAFGGRYYNPAPPLNLRFGIGVRL